MTFALAVFCAWYMTAGGELARAGPVSWELLLAGLMFASEWPRVTYHPWRAWSIDVLIAKLCEVELGEAFGVGEEVDLGDLAILDRESGN